MLKFVSVGKIGQSMTHFPTVFADNFFTNYYFVNLVFDSLNLVCFLSEINWYAAININFVTVQIPKAKVSISMFQDIAFSLVVGAHMYSKGHLIDFLAPFLTLSIINF